MPIAPLKWMDDKVGDMREFLAFAYGGFPWAGMTKGGKSHGAR